MIPIARPILGSEEQEAVLRVLASGQLAQGEHLASRIPQLFILSCKNHIEEDFSKVLCSLKIFLQQAPCH